jgi:SAM-dependent methyltransferase
MIYIAEIEDDRALIVDGPVFAKRKPHILTSANLDDVAGSWEFNILADKKAEAPAQRVNGLDALAKIESHLDNASASPRLLDFGSGFGFFLGVVKEYGWEPVGLEPLPASSVYARATFGVEVATDTLRPDTFPADHFDVVTAFQVFEHLESPGEVLTVLQRALRPGGIILIEVPNIDSWSTRLMRSRCRHYVPDHINFFSADTLRHLMEVCGFEVLELYNPARCMSIRHLLSTWGKRYLTKTGADVLCSIAKKVGLWEATVHINIGDIVTAIGRKSDQPISATPI